MKKFLHFTSIFLTSLSVYASASQDEIMEQINKENIYAVDFVFSDLLGNVKAVTIPTAYVKDTLQRGLKFDGSSVPGCSNITESDMHLAPDLCTWRMLPQQKGLILCDVCLSEDEIYTGDARQQLKEAVNRLSKHNLTFYAGAEIEFYLFDADGNPIDEGCYFDYSHKQEDTSLHREILETLKTSGINVIKLHHEVSHGQYEVVLHHATAVDLADQILLTKHIIKSVAHNHGLTANFMPKPIANMNGSGMHIHYSLWNTNKNVNAFFDHAHELKLSSVAQAFIAGNLHYMPEMAVCFNSTVNSYKRLVPGYEAPIYICWGAKNRSALIRIPQINQDECNACRAEMRSPDALCNPYLMLSALILSGLEGIKNEMPLAPETRSNLYKLSGQQLKSLNIQSLPTSLPEALKAFQDSDFTQQCFNSMLKQQFINLKSKEVREFATNVTCWEMNRY